MVAACDWSLRYSFFCPPRRGCPLCGLQNEQCRRGQSHLLLRVAVWRLAFNCLPNGLIIRQRCTFLHGSISTRTTIPSPHSSQSFYRDILCLPLADCAVGAAPRKELCCFSPLSRCSHIRVVVPCCAGAWMSLLSTPLLLCTHSLSAVNCFRHVITATLGLL